VVFSNGETFPIVRRHVTVDNRYNKTMAGEGSAGQIITKFIHDTCRLRPQLSQPASEAALRCAQLAAQHPPNDAEAHHIPLTTGSVAEFYIEPMLPHIGDIDVMHHWSE